MVLLDQGGAAEVTTTINPADLERVLADPGFGRYFTDSMASAVWTSSGGWSDVRIEPFGPLALSPAAMVLHYGQAIFEGLKAHRQRDGGVVLFRPAENARRFNRSAARLAMPELPESLFIAACADLVRADRGWVPTQPGHSLYLRPLMIATEAALGVRAAEEYRFVVMASPAASYFASDAESISVWIADGCTRAAPGGTGAAKCAGNYGAGLLGKQQAEANGCDEVVWLDAVERRFAEEMGGMNLFLVRGDGAKPVLVTPPATDTILDGITRSSLIALAPRLGFEVREEPIAVEEWRRDATIGAVTEAFACGTAAVVAPIGVARSTEGEWTMGDGAPGPAATALRGALLAIQEGTADDPFGWRVPVD